MPTVVARMERSGMRGREREPGFRFAHPGYKAGREPLNSR